MIYGYARVSSYGQALEAQLEQLGNAGCARIYRGNATGARPDTATGTGRLMIAVLGGLADVERDLVRSRTAEGRSRAKARGQHMGRPPKSHAAAAEGGTAAAGRGRDAEGACQELQRRQVDDFEAQRLALPPSLKASPGAA